MVAVIPTDSAHGGVRLDTMSDQRDDSLNGNSAHATAPAGGDAEYATLSAIHAWR